MRNRGFAAKGMLVGMLIGLLPACKSPPPPGQSKQKGSIPQRAIELAAKYKAIHTWREGLKREALETTYTLDVERALVEAPQEHPVLVIGQVQDVFRRDGQLWVRLSNLNPESPNIDFELSCSADALRPVFEKRDMFGSFALVARIRKVRKFNLELQVIPIDEEHAEYEVNPLFTAGEERFLATGDCLEAAYVGMGPTFGRRPEKANQ